MVKTKVLLAFGEHSGEPAPKRFFRRAIVPFLERHSRLGGRATIIYETGILPSEMREFFSLRKLKTPEAIRMALARATEHMERTRDGTAAQNKLDEDLRSLNDLLKRTADVGKHPLKTRFQVTRGGEEPVPNLRGTFGIWGFEDVVLRLNKACPGRISNIIEPQNQENPQLVYMWKLYELGLALKPDGQTHTILGMIRNLARLAATRDADLFLLAEKLADEEPEKAIIIPRGYYHKEMARLFDRKKFDVEVKIQGFTPEFMHEAASRLFYDCIDDDRLARYADLQLHFFDFLVFKKAYPDILDALLRFVGARDYAEERMKKKAREHALKISPESKLLLGY